MPLPNPTLPRKLYRADVVRAMILNGYKDGYLDGKADGASEAEEHYRPKQLERDRQRLQVAHEFLTTLRTIIDP